MQGLTIDVFLSIAVPLSLYFIITLFGAFIKDLVNSMKGTDTTFRLNRILIGATFGAFLMLALEKYLLTKMSVESIVFVAFFVGSVSFELFDRLSKVDNLIKYWRTYQEIKQGKIPTTGNSTTQEEEDKNSNNTR